MARPLSDQVFVVTGASSGIGRATAMALAGRGAKVVGAARGRDALSSLVVEIKRGTGTAVAVPTDVAEWEQVQELAAAAVERFGRIDTWVNNAAVSMYGRVEDVTPAEVDRVMRVNFLGQVHGVYAALPHLRAAGGGTIIGVSSVLGVRAVPLQAAYVASKHALRGFYDTLRMELQHEGAPIAVTTLLPASIDTPLFAHARSRMAELPQPVPPVYSADVVANAIVRAAERPTREVLVGGSGLGFLVGQRLAPALLDRLMTAGGLLFRLQQDQRADDRVDNLEVPVPGPGRVSGPWQGTVRGSSAYTDLVGQRPAVRAALTAATVGLLARRLSHKTS